MGTFFLLPRTMKVLLCAVLLIVLLGMAIAEKAPHPLKVNAKEVLASLDGYSSTFEDRDVHTRNHVPAIFAQLCTFSSEIRSRNSKLINTKKHIFTEPWYC